MENQPHIVVTGANGFVGRAFCQLLHDKNLPHTPLCRPKSRHQPPGAVEVDLNDTKALEKVLPKHAILVHLIAKTHDRQTKPDSSEYRATNVELTRQVATAAVNQQCQRIVYLSSIKVNGEHTLTTPFTSKDTPRPASIYGETKLQAEQVLKTLCGQHDTELVILRPPLVYAPHAKGNIELLRKLIDRKLPIPLAAINNKRSIIELNDLCDRLLHCATDPTHVGQTLLCQTETLSTPDMIRKLAQDINQSARLFSVPNWLNHLAACATGRRSQWQKLFENLEVDDADWHHHSSKAPHHG